MRDQPLLLIDSNIPDLRRQVERLFDEVKGRFLVHMANTISVLTWSSTNRISASAGIVAVLCHTPETAVITEI